MKVCLKIHLENEEGGFCLGPGCRDLLRLIDATGSVASAAGQMELSYSKAWKMIREAEKGFGKSLVERSCGGQGGGSACLTEQASRLLESYDGLSRELDKLALELGKRTFES